MQAASFKLSKNQKCEPVAEDPRSIPAFDPLIPSDITLADVLGYCELLGENGFALPISSRRTQFYRGSSEFLSLLASGRMLGLTSRENNRLILTPLGIGFLKAEFPEKMGILRARLSVIEPFKSALELASKRKSINATDVAERVSMKYAMGEFDPRTIRLVLIEWAIPTGLFELNRKGDFVYFHHNSNNPLAIMMDAKCGVAIFPTVDLDGSRMPRINRH